MSVDQPDGSVSVWLDELKAGDSRAVNELWARYFTTLVAVARRSLGNAQKRASDEEDVALSAFDSFVRGVDRGNFARLSDRNDLWRLLLVITLRKAADHRLSEQRQKRGSGRVRAESELDGDDKAFSLDRVWSNEPTPEIEAMLREEITRLMDRLEDEQLKAIALAKMEGHTDDQIAEQQKCVRRTIVRKLAVIRQLWASEDGA